MMDVKSVRPKDWVSFHCRLCGNCCRNVEDKIMVEPLDAFNLARCLRERGEVEYVEDVYSRYTHPDMLEGFYPIFLMNTTGPDNACVFLEDSRCSVYEARPKVCRIYPFTVDTGQRGKAFEFYQCMDCHSSHFSDGKVLVKDWIYQNFKREDREFMTAESVGLTELGRLLRILGPKKVEANLFQILYYRYFNYDLDQPFMPQYTKNMETLKGILQDVLGR